MKLSRKQLQEAADYWNEQHGLPATSAEMIIHLATYKNLRFANKKVNDKNEVAPDVMLTEEEEKEIKSIFASGYNWALETLSNYKLAHGKRYKSDYHALLGWVKRTYHEQLAKSKITGTNGLTASDIRMDQWARNKTNQNTGSGNVASFAQSSEVKQD